MDSRIDVAHTYRVIYNAGQQLWEFGSYADRTEAERVGAALAEQNGIEVGVYRQAADAYMIARFPAGKNPSPRQGPTPLGKSGGSDLVTFPE